jgi:hypothetical protein
MDAYSDRRSGAGGSVSAVLPCTNVSAIGAPRRGVLGVTEPRRPDQVNPGALYRPKTRSRKNGATTSPPRLAQTPAVLERCPSDRDPTRASGASTAHVSGAGRRRWACRDVTVRYPGSPTDEWLNYRSERAAEVVVNSSIPWDIKVRGRASRFLADMRELRLGFQAPGDMRWKRLGPTRNEQVSVANRLVGSLFPVSPGCCMRTPRSRFARR